MHLTYKRDRHPVTLQLLPAQNDPRSTVAGAGNNACNSPIVGLLTSSQGIFLVYHHHGSRLNLLSARYVEVLCTVLIDELNVSGNHHITPEPACQTVRVVLACTVEV